MRVREFTYDKINRQTTEEWLENSSHAVTKRVRYTYDALNRRIGKEIDANADSTYETVERYAYDGDNLVFAFDGTGDLLQRYLHGAGVDDVVAEEDGAGDVTWMLPDHQGSVRDVIESDGTNLDHVVYDSFGKVLSRTGTTTLRYAYTGRELDQESGLYFYRARYYDASVGRFIGQDPSGFGGGDDNLYRYVGNSTVNFRDPTGMTAQENAEARGDDWAAANWKGATKGKGLGPLDPARVREATELYEERQRTAESLAKMKDLLKEGNDWINKLIDIDRSHNMSAYALDTYLKNVDRQIARLGGAIKLINGTLEMAWGVAALLAPEPTGLSKAGGHTLIVHGADWFWSGIRSLATGRPDQTYTSMGLEYVYHTAGVENAREMADYTDVAISFAAAGAATYGAGVGVSSESILMREAVSRFGPSRAPTAAEYIRGAGTTQREIGY